VVLTVLAAVVLLVPAVIRSAAAQAGSAAGHAVGRVTGNVVFDRDGQPVEYANVLVVGRAQGAVTKNDGSFAIDLVPAGPQTIQVTYLGYVTERREIIVSPEAAVTLSFRLKETVAKQEKEILVTGERPLVEVEKASSTRSYNQEELKRLTVLPTLDSVVEQAPGVTRDNNEIHIRGGRADETLFIIDGVEMRDVLTGVSKGENISSRSIAEVNIITGGFDAQYGNAMSGVIEAKTKEGTEDYHGALRYETDRPTGDLDLDNWNFQLSGPIPLFQRAARGLGADRPSAATFFIDLSADLSNGYLPNIKDFQTDATRRAALGGDPGIGRNLESSYSERIFGQKYRYGEFFYPRASNQWRSVVKAAWRASERHKFNVFLSKSLSFDQGFGDTDIGAIDRNTLNYPWAWSRRLDRYYTVTYDQNNLALTWNWAVNPALVSIMKITRSFETRHQDVAGQLFTEFDQSTDQDLPPSSDVYDTPYFYDVGDAPQYTDRYAETWALDWNWSRKWKAHDLGWGAGAQYEDVQFLTVDAATITADRPLGDEFDLFHVTPNTGHFYVQDRIQFQGLIANLGLRYDYWFPGSQVEKLYDNYYLTGERPTITPVTRQEFLDSTHELFGHRFKGRLLPRVQVSHPISQRNKLFFNYGHFSQLPAYFYVYAKSSSQSSAEFPRIGNPNLNPEVSVQYELGAAHQFTDQMAAQVTLFSKDIYDYPTSVPLTLLDRNTTRANFYVYRNLDYARSRGVEIELRKRRERHASWSLDYSYSSAKGKSSDPNLLSVVRETGGDARNTMLEEQYMWWNRPHKFSARFDYRINRGEDRPRLFGVRLPEDASLNLYYQIRSGRPYTPTSPDGRQIGQAYSRNGPYDATLNATLTKAFQLGGRRFEVTVQGWNLFDHRTLLSLDPATGKRWKPGEGSLNGFSENPANLNLDDEELVRQSGLNPDPGETVADLATQIRRAILATVYRYQDPSMRSAPRSIRVGLGMEW